MSEWLLPPQVMDDMLSEQRRVIDDLTHLADIASAWCSSDGTFTFAYHHGEPAAARGQALIGEVLAVREEPLP